MAMYREVEKGMPFSYIVNVGGGGTYKKYSNAKRRHGISLGAKIKENL